MNLDNFKKLIKSNNSVFVCATASWCKPCAKFKQQIYHIKNSYITENEPIYVFDADADEEIIAFCAVTGFPTVQVWVHGTLLVEQKGKEVDLNSLIEKFGDLRDDTSFDNNLSDF